MKRLILLILLLACLLSCTGCAPEEPDQPAFYYLRPEDAIVYGQDDALMVPVPQEITPEVDLNMVLQLYLDGPVEENLRDPFPKGTYLLTTIAQEDTLVVVLSREFSTLDGIQLTLAGACLAATCYDLTGMEHIKVHSGDSTYDFDLNSFIFLDSIPEK